MSVFDGFNMFNPFSWMNLQPPSVFPLQKPIADGTPIAIKGSSSDPGAKLSVDKKSNAITISGVAKGPRIVGDLSETGWGYLVGRGMGFSLDIDKAPTVDIYGKTNYTAKNNRLFSLDTAKGWTAQQCAQRLADKVNAAFEYKATVTAHRNGSATIQFERR